MTAAMPVDIRIETPRWPVAGSFTISRGSRTEAQVVQVILTGDRRRGVGRNRVTGRGECVPYPHYGESVASVVAAIEAVRGDILAGMDRLALQEAMPAGAARNAIDCALWDLEAKRSGKPAWQIAALDEPKPVETAYTISLADPQTMADKAEAVSGRSLLKIKLGGDGDHERMIAVRKAAPDSRLILDANEAWRPDTLPGLMETATKISAAIIEQPLPAGDDAVLADIRRPVPVCADESLHTSAELHELAERYDCINIKLDKTGGLTEALALKAEARRLGLQVMVGCMLGSSLAMAPAILLAGDVEFVDLDAPLLLARDIENGLDYPGSQVAPPSPALWG